MRLPPLTTAAALAVLALAACERPAPPPAAAGPSAPGASPVEERPYQVALQPPAAARAGQPATARVVIRATGTFHVNRDYPMAFRPEPASAAAFGGERVALGEGAERTPCAAHPEEACAVSAPLPFTPGAPGESTLAGTVAFSVCTPELCRIEKVPLTMAITASR